MDIVFCFECKGEMKKPVPRHSYDFNKDGWVPRYCIDCGLCSDVEKIITTHMVVYTLGHRFIERIMEEICRNKLHQDYIFKKETLKLLKMTSFFNADDLAKEIYSQCQDRDYDITEDYILKVIYSELDYSAFIQNTVTGPQGEIIFSQLFLYLHAIDCVKLYGLLQLTFIL